MAVRIEADFCLPQVKDLVSSGVPGWDADPIQTAFVYPSEYKAPF